MTPERFRKIKAVLDARQPDLTVVMENISKPHNLGAVMRTCDAVGVLDVHAVWSARARRIGNAVTAGSRKWVAVHHHATVGDALSRLRGSGFRILAAHLSASAKDFREVDFTLPSAIVLGTELYGLSDEAAALCDQHVVVPMLGMVASLNVSVANAALLFEAQRQRLTAGLYARTRLSPEAYRTLLFEWCYPVLARRCRESCEPYPILAEDGSLPPPSRAHIAHRSAPIKG